MADSTWNWQSVPSSWNPWALEIRSGIGPSLFYGLVPWIQTLPPLRPVKVSLAAVPPMCLPIPSRTKYSPALETQREHEMHRRPPPFHASTSSEDKWAGTQGGCRPPRLGYRRHAGTALSPAWPLLTVVCAHSELRALHTWRVTSGTGWWRTETGLQAGLCTVPSKRHLFQP